MKREAKNFYWGLRLTPEPRRGALYSIYAWMREGDDIADEPGRGGDFGLFVERTRAALAGMPDGEGFWPAFAEAVKTHQIEPGWIEAMLEGFASDLAGRQPTTEEDLERYCYQVGAVVGMCCVAVWGVRDAGDAARERAMVMAAECGIAFQITNILRDIGTDAVLSPSRCYVPMEWLNRHSMSAAELAAWAKPEECCGVVEPLIDRAKSAYANSNGLRELIREDCVPVLWTMTRMYRSILQQIEEEPSRVVMHPPVRIPTWRKTATMMAAMVVRPWRWESQRGGAVRR